MLCISAPAGEKYKVIKLADGTELQDVEVIAVLPHGVKVTHRNGGGLIPAAKLPPDLKKLQEAEALKGAMEDKKKAEELAKIKEREEAAMKITQQRLTPLLLTCTLVEPCHTKGIMAGPGYRYSLKLKNQSGKTMKGTLRISGVTVEGTMVGNEKQECDLTDGQWIYPTLETFTAPPIKYGNVPGVGVSGMFWTFIPEDGGPDVTGKCTVPNKIN